MTTFIKQQSVFIILALLSTTLGFTCVAGESFLALPFFIGAIAALIVPVLTFEKPEKVRVNTEMITVVLENANWNTYKDINSKRQFIKVKGEFFSFYDMQATSSKFVNIVVA